MSNHPIFSWPQTNDFPDVLNIGRYFTNNKFAESCRMGSIFGLLPATVSPQILQYPLPPRQTSACSGHLQYSTSTPALCIRSRVFAIITNLQTSFMAFNQSFNRCCFSSKTDFQLEVVLSLQLTLETLPKAQRTRGLSSSYQSNYLRSYHKFKHKSWSNSSSESRLSINFSAKH